MVLDTVHKLFKSWWFDYEVWDFLRLANVFFDKGWIGDESVPRLAHTIESQDGFHVKAR